MTEPLDSQKYAPALGGPSFSLANRMERLAFTLCWRLLAWVFPPPFGFGWRRAILRLFGAEMNATTKVYPSVRVWLPRNLVMLEGSTLGPGVDCYNMAPVRLGKGATVSQRAVLCGGDHDFRQASLQLITKPIDIGDHVWIAAEAFVGPGVTVGDRAIVGARCCAMREIPADTVWAGNPAQMVSQRQD